MSHTTTLRSIKITDMSAVEAAVSELKSLGINCELVRNQQPGMYYENQQGNCDYVLRLPTARGRGARGQTQYDIGFTKAADGSYDMVFDDFNNALRNVLGAACPMPTTPEGVAQHAIGKFTQLYAKHATINAAISQGYQIEGTSYDEQGNLQLMIAV